MARLTLLSSVLVLAACGGAAHEVTAPVATSSAAQLPAVPEARAPEDVDAATAVHAHARCVLAIDFAASRAHPLGRAAESTLMKMPPFDGFGPDFEPLLDADWMVYAGPRFFPNRDSGFVVRYSVPEATIDGAFNTVTSREPVEQLEHGVTMGLVDRFPRALLRPQQGIMALVPPALAARVTQALAHGNVVPPLHAGEAARVSMRRPGAVSALVPESVYEARAWAVLRDDGGADLFAELDCPFDSDAVVVSNELRRTLAGYAKGPARLLLHGLLDAVEVKPEGKLVKLHATATEEQGEALLGILDARVRARSPP